MSINHFSMEQERIVVVSPKAVYRVKYDFMNKVVEKTIRTDLMKVNRVLKGPLMWGDKAAMVMQSTSKGSLDQGAEGIRLVEGTGETSWYTRWNPMATVPYQTFRSHPGNLDSSEELPEQDVGNCHACIVEALQALHGPEVQEKCDIVDNTIRLEAAISGRLYNDNNFGKKMERGGVSF